MNVYTPARKPTHVNRLSVFPCASANMFFFISTRKPAQRFGTFRIALRDRLRAGVFGGTPKIMRLIIFGFALE